MVIGADTSQNNEGTDYFQAVKIHAKLKKLIYMLIDVNFILGTIRKGLSSTTECMNKEIKTALENKQIQARVTLITIAVWRNGSCWPITSYCHWILIGSPILIY